MYGPTRTACFIDLMEFSFRICEKRPKKAFIKFDIDMRRIPDSRIMRTAA